MLEEEIKNTDKRGNISRFYKNEFYAAILDEDVGHLDHLIKKYGSNFLIETQDGACGGVHWKVRTPTKPSALVVGTKWLHKKNKN